ncbi:MAG TPA: hypothetical protein VKX49_23960 [Bryobacteraceae bacterium]|nr:hypothetical protein [Bryobacteraceae bacterium]
MERKLFRVLFPYLIVFVVLIALIASFGMMAGIPGWQIWVWGIGACLVVGAGMFSFFEVRRLAGISKSEHERAREEAEADRITRHSAIVEGPTGEPYPHHEDHIESRGRDQGQITSSLPEPTPLVGELVEHKKKD